MDEFFTELLSFIIKAQNELADGRISPDARIEGAFQCLAEARAMIIDIPSGEMIANNASHKAKDIAIVRS